MNGIVSILLIVGGIVLLVLGIQAADSLGSQFSRFFTGEPTDKAIWMLLIGGLLLVVGLGSLVPRGTRAA